MDDEVVFTKGLPRFRGEEWSPRLACFESRLPTTIEQLSSLVRQDDSELHHRALGYTPPLLRSVPDMVGPPGRLLAALMPPPVTAA